MLLAALKEISLNPNIDVQKVVMKTLLKLSDNVLNNPAVEKYRRIRPENPQIKSRIFDVKGGRTALRGIGFGLSDCGEYYEYRGAPLDKCTAILRERMQELEDGNALGQQQENSNSNANRDPARGYVRRQGPQANDFKRFKDGIQGLRDRWSETSFVLSRGAPRTPGQLVIVEKSVEIAHEFLELLEATAREYDCLQGYIYQHLVHKCGNGDETVANRLRAEGQATCQAIVDGAERFRQTLRVKIADDADLDTARRAVLDTREFIRLLKEEAGKAGTTPFNLLQEL